MFVPNDFIFLDGRALPAIRGGGPSPHVWIDVSRYVANDRHRRPQPEWRLPDEHGGARGRREPTDGDRRQPCGGSRVSTKLELILYVSAASPASARAELAMKEVLKRFARDEISYTVCDLATHPGEAERDRVIFTPTLVKRFPGPRAWVLGNLDNPSIVVELLMAAGVTPLP